jgi:hypothetical protein
MTDYPLETLDLQPGVVSRLRSLGLSTVGGLQAMIEAAPHDLARFLGRETLAAVRSAVDAVSPRPPSLGFSPRDVVHGARLEPPPSRLADPPDHSRREALFTELQNLRQDPQPVENRRRIRELETQLNALLDAEANR